MQLAEKPRKVHVFQRLAGDKIRNERICVPPIAMFEVRELTVLDRSGPFKLSDDYSCRHSSGFRRSHDSAGTHRLPIDQVMTDFVWQQDPLRIRIGFVFLGLDTPPHDLEAFSVDVTPTVKNNVRGFVEKGEPEVVLGEVSEAQVNIRPTACIEPRRATGPTAVRSPRTRNRYAQRATSFSQSLQNNSRVFESRHALQRWQNASETVAVKMSSRLT